MSSNLADLPPSTDILWSRWVEIWQIYPPLLTSCGQDELKFGRSTPRSASRSTPQYWHLAVKMSSNLADLSPQYWHLMVKMSSNLADLCLDLLADLPPVLTSCGQDEFKFGRSTPRSASRSTPSTDILWSRWVQIWQIYPPSFLDLQKSLLVSFQGCWTQWQRFESSSTHHFWDFP